MGLPLFVKEQDAGTYIPYAAQISPSVIKTWNGDYIAVFRLNGAAHETADPEDLTLWKDQLNNLWRNTLSHPKISLWTHIIRRKQSDLPGGKFTHPFCRGLNEKYKACLSPSASPKSGDTGGTMMVNELYVSIVYRPNLGLMGRSLFGKGGKSVDSDEVRDHLDVLSEAVGNICAGLARYEPTILGLYTNPDGVTCSEALEFLGYLCNGEHQPMALPQAGISDYLQTARPFFGQESLELRQATRSRFGAILGIKEYMESTGAGMLNRLLQAPFEFVLTQSFEPIVRPEALSTMQRAQGRMLQAKEQATSLIADLDVALDDVSVGRVVMGYHHWTLLVFADSPVDLKRCFADARSSLAELGMVTAREDLALEAAFWAQLPGNFKLRPRPCMISSKNFCAFAGYHNYPTGRISGNQWGPALTTFKTNSGAPLYFSFHKASNSQEKSLANTLITGTSGSGKTVMQALLISEAQKFQPTVFAIDKDRGLDLFIRRIGGVYLPLKKGQPTGMNPFCLENTPENAAFLEDFIKTLIAPTGNDPYHVSVSEEKEIAKAVQGALALQDRSLSHVLAFLDPTNEHGARARLAKWAANDGEGRPGALAWVFDSGPDLLDFSEKRAFGFDVTEFLDDDLIRPAITMYLFRRMEQLIDGRNFICVLDEFWKMLGDPYFQDFVQNKLKTIRKQNGLLVFGTQSPKDILRSPIAHSIIEQCPNQFFLYNERADEDDYVNGFKLSRSAFNVFKDITPARRLFLLRQGSNCSLASMALKGDFGNELAIMSGTTDNILLFEQIMNEYPHLPQDSEEIWDIFHRQRRR